MSKPKKAPKWEYRNVYLDGDRLEIGNIRYLKRKDADEIGELFTVIKYVATVRLPYTPKAKG